MSKVSDFEYQVIDEITGEVFFRNKYYKYCLDYFKEHFIKNNNLHIIEVRF